MRWFGRIPRSRCQGVPTSPLPMSSSLYEPMSAPDRTSSNFKSDVGYAIVNSSYVVVSVYEVAAAKSRPDRSIRQAALTERGVQVLYYKAR